MDDRIILSNYSNSFPLNELERGIGELDPSIEKGMNEKQWSTIDQEGEKRSTKKSSDPLLTKRGGERIFQAALWFILGGWADNPIGEEFH